MKNSLCAFVSLLVVAPSILSAQFEKIEPFPEFPPLRVIRGIEPGSVFLPFTEESYVPLEVVSEAHPAQKLTVFHPREVSGDERFPAIFYSPAFAYVEPPIPNPPNRLVLLEALRRGWAVITVGTTGLTSIPVCSQPIECNAPSNSEICASRPSGCKDVSLWYGQDTVQSSPWNTFDYILGERDMIWARQYIAEHATRLSIDNNKIVACGTSSGAIYAALLAYDSRPWDQANFVGVTLPPQLTKDTSVAAALLFEPICWIQAYGPVITSGQHWPVSPNLLNPNFVRAEMLGQVAGSTMSVLSASAAHVLQTNSMSKWVREGLPHVPTFVGSGDGNDAFTDFGRNASMHPGDYTRDATSVPPNNPTPYVWNPSCTPAS